MAKARQTAVEVVHAAIDALERQEFLRGRNGDYQRIFLYASCHRPFQVVGSIQYSGSGPRRAEGARTHPVPAAKRL
jgi:hypothetical protein